MQGNISGKNFSTGRYITAEIMVATVLHCPAFRFLSCNVLTFFFYYNFVLHKQLTWIFSQGASIKQVRLLTGQGSEFIRSFKLMYKERFTVYHNYNLMSCIFSFSITSSSILPFLSISQAQMYYPSSPQLPYDFCQLVSLLPIDLISTYVAFRH